MLSPTSGFRLDIESLTGGDPEIIKRAFIELQRYLDKVYSDIYREFSLREIVIKTTTGDPASPPEKYMVINSFDNTFKIYADGAWRTLATW